MTEVLVVTQYGTAEVALTDADARAIGDAAGPALTVSMGASPGNWQLTAAEYVGTISVGDRRVLIRPKIPPENLFLLLEVGLDESAWRREAFDYATSSDLLPALIAFFARATETTLARGVLRSYQPMADRLHTVRGRIDIATVARRPGPITPLACRFDEFTTDIAENRYLRAALRRAVYVPGVLGEDRRRMLRLIADLEDVTDVPVRPDELDQIHITRLNQHYEPALSLARLLLSNLTLSDQSGSTSASSFLVDMNNLFERFVTARLRRSLSGRLDVIAEPPQYLGEGRQVYMKPDLDFRRHGETVFVGDCKYKIAADAKARNPDYYQLLAYTTAMDVPEGVLVYCLGDDGGRQRRTVTVRHTGKRLTTYAIRLSGSAAEIQGEIETLADWIVERSRLSHVALARTATA